MSIDSELIRCSGCDYETREVYRPIYLVYRDKEGREIPARRSRGWCYHCDTYQDKESIDPQPIKQNIQKLMPQRASLTIALQSLPGGWLAWFKKHHKKKNLKYQRSLIDEELSELYALEKLLEQRESAGRCLTCHSEDTAEIRFDHTDGMARNFRHICGGYLYIVPEEDDPSPIRYNFRRSTMVLDPEGKLLEVRRD